MTPNLISAYRLCDGAYNNTTRAIYDGTYRQARPVGCAGLIQRTVWAWRVFTGRYDALVWYGQEGIEEPRP